MATAAALAADEIEVPDWVMVRDVDAYRKIAAKRGEEAAAEFARASKAARLKMTPDPAKAPMPSLLNP